MAKKYSINIYTKYEGLLPVVGERIKSKIAPRQWFILHKSVDYPDTWSITETQSGLAVVKDFKTRESAINELDIVLAKQSVERLDEVIEEVIATNGCGVVNYEINEVK